MFGVTVPLGGGGTPSRKSRRPNAPATRPDADRTAAFVRVRAQLFEIYQELLDAISESEILDEDLLPQMDESMQETQYAFDRAATAIANW